MRRPLAQHSDADSDVPETVAPGEVLRRIAWRFERGVPSDILGEAGVLVHVHDGNEDVARPWLLCETSLECSTGSVDAWSASVISRKVPWLYEETKNGGGFIIHPSVEILCAYPSDVGTLGSAQRPGACSGLRSPGFVWSTLGAALRPQYDGSWRRQWPALRAALRWIDYSTPRQLSKLSVAETLSTNSPKASLDQRAGLLQRQGWQIQRHDDRLAARKGLLGRVGPLLVHAGMVVLMLGAAWGALGGQRAEQYLAPGRSLLLFSTDTPATRESTAADARALAFALYDPRLSVPNP
jgi:hypothetical protein